MPTFTPSPVRAAVENETVPQESASSSLWSGSLHIPGMAVPLSFIICLDIWTQALTSQLFVPPLGGSWAGE